MIWNLKFIPFSHLVTLFISSELNAKSFHFCSYDAHFLIFLRHNNTNISTDGKKNILPNIDIDEMYSSLCELTEDDTGNSHVIEGEEFGRQVAKEEFWRNMEQSDDPFETICLYISRGTLEDI